MRRYVLNAKIREVLGQKVEIKSLQPVENRLGVLRLAGPEQSRRAPRKRKMLKDFSVLTHRPEAYCTPRSCTAKSLV